MKPRLPHIALAAALLAATVLAPAGASGLLSPEVEEQRLIYELNRARWDPWGYAAAHGVTPASTSEPLIPQPPLAVNANLNTATGFKAQQTADYPNLFNPTTHCTTAPGPRPCPDGLARYYGYPLAGSGDNVNTIETYWASGGPNAEPAMLADVANFITSPWHLPIMFQWKRHEVGAGWAYGCAVTPSVCRPNGGPPNNVSYLFFNIGSRSQVQLFVTGVVYDDTNGNGVMDAGEGLSGVTVSRPGASVTTNAGGGYSLPVGDGAGYRVTASGSGLSSTVDVCVVGSNVGIDFEKGSLPEVHGFPGRIAGSDRYATGTEASQCFRPQPFATNSGVVYLAVGTNYPDALAAGPAAAVEGAPILLTDPGAVPAVTEAELVRLHPNEVVVLGGTAAISDAVLGRVEQLLPNATVTRRWGATRYETAAAITQGAFGGSVDTLYIATGENFPDALIAAPAAIHDGAPLLLVRPDAIPDAIAAEIDRLSPARIVVVGDTGAVSNQVLNLLKTYAPTTRISGADRYALSAAVATAVFPDATTALVATGNNFPDALASGPLTALFDGPILLMSGTVPTAVATALDAIAPTTILVLGGPAAVPDGVLVQLVGYLGS